MRDLVRWGWEGEDEDDGDEDEDGVGISTLAYRLDRVLGYSKGNDIFV